MMRRSLFLRSMDRTYQSAVEILHSRRRPKRPSATSGHVRGSVDLRDVGGTTDLRGTPSIVGMKQWLHELGYAAADINKLNIIHVAGTKGKGSTAAWTESFLRAVGQRTGFPAKTGLYTSPHLIYPEERIRINFKPIPRDLFAKYFFEVWDALSTNRDKPRYLQLILLVSFHAFIKENVEAAVFECHHGGEYDATNVIEQPVVSIVAPLGMDHVEQLGPTIENIAWHKAGIFKRGARAFSHPQDNSAARVLQERASDKDVDLRFVENDPSLPADALQLKPMVQRSNCSVALAAVRAFLVDKARDKYRHITSADIVQGINQFVWPGRFQHVAEGTCHWYLDGAHNEMSATVAAEWFIETLQAERVTNSSARILIFSQISPNRDPEMVLGQLAQSLTTTDIQHVIFTAYEPHQSFEAASVSVPKELDQLSQRRFADVWKRVHTGSEIHFERNIQEAMATARNIGAKHGGMRALITGSQYLVGGALFHLDSDKTFDVPH